MIDGRVGKEKTMIVFDWDDTLMASTFICDAASNGCQQLSDDIEFIFKSIEIMILRLFSVAHQLGHLVIVTNAESGWVQYSAKKYLPGIVPVLSSIPVISARFMFSQQYPGQPSMWKLCAFSFLLEQYPNVMNFISIGDSDAEREATYNSKLLLSSSQGMKKSIKLSSQPSPYQLLYQIQTLLYSFSDLILHPGNLDLVLACGI